MGRSGVRITGGALRGRVVRVPDARGVRPTTGRVREALFNMVGQHLDGWSVLDVFGGSGLLAFEAASRGARPLRLIERQGRVARDVAAAARVLGVELEVWSHEATRALALMHAQEERWDLVLLDPPYADDPVRWATLAAPLVGRVLVVEHRAGASLPARIEGLIVDRRKNYGDSALCVYRRALAGLDEAQPVGQDAGVVEGEG